MGFPMTHLHVKFNQRRINFYRPIWVFTHSLVEGYAHFQALTKK